MDRISVIIPAYNAETSLKRGLDSVFAQTLQSHQVIVVDDGSTDKTSTIARQYGREVEYVYQANQGPGKSRNTGLELACNELIAFLDADDYWLPTFLSECTIFLKDNPEAVAVTTGQYIKLWGHSDIVRPPLLQNPDCPKAPFIIDNFFSFWAEHNHVVTGASLIRRSVIERAGYQRTDFRICEDLEYWGYLATFGKWGFIPEVLWVGDPTPAAASQGWMKKHEKRWKDLPNIEDWENRIKPRLKDEDIEGFEIVKARIAASLVHQNILAGNLSKARSVFLSFRKKHPKNWITRFLNLGDMAGSFGWFTMCKLIQVREYVKAFGIYLSTIHRLHAKERK